MFYTLDTQRYDCGTDGYSLLLTTWTWLNILQWLPMKN